MKLAHRVGLIVTPLLALPTTAVYYTHLNMGDRMFVDKLGCGCGPFFNTNHLTVTVAIALWGSAVAAWWIASRGLAFPWRMVLFTAGFLAIGRFWFRPFLDYNFWL